jgi:hypothetical protein
VSEASRARPRSGLPIPTNLRPELLNSHPSAEKFWERRVTARLSDKLATATPLNSYDDLEQKFVGRLDRISLPDVTVRVTVPAPTSSSFRRTLLFLSGEFGRRRGSAAGGLDGLYGDGLDSLIKVSLAGSNHT